MYLIITLRIKIFNKFLLRHNKNRTKNKDLNLKIQRKHKSRKPIKAMDRFKIISKTIKIKSLSKML